MGIYSETLSNTPVVEIEEPTNCYNCNNDCMGIFDIIFQEGGSYE